MEVIDVDEEQEISSRDTNPKKRVARSIQEVHGKNFEIYDTMADFLSYITGEYQESVNEGNEESTAGQGHQYVNHFGPITITSLFYMCAMAYSQLFHYLTNKKSLD